jgi:hypothetical protein
MAGRRHGEVAGGSPVRARYDATMGSYIENVEGGIGEIAATPGVDQKTPGRRSLGALCCYYLGGPDMWGVWMLAGSLIYLAVWLAVIT